MWLVLLKSTLVAIWKRYEGRKSWRQRPQSDLFQQAPWAWTKEEWIGVEMESVFVTDSLNFIIRVNSFVLCLILGTHFLVE